MVDRKCSTQYVSWFTLELHQNFFHSQYNLTLCQHVQTNHLIRQFRGQIITSSQGNLLILKLCFFTIDKTKEDLKYA